MKNIKGLAMVSDGNLKRMAITYDVIGDDGTISITNRRINKIVVEPDAIEAINKLETYAQSIVDSMEI